MNTIKINIAMRVFLLCAILSSCSYNNLEGIKPVKKVKYQTWVYLNTQNSALSGDYVYGLDKDSKGNIWAITNKNFLHKISPNLTIESFEIPFSDSIDEFNKVATEIKIDKFDRIWIGAITRPLYCFNNGSWTKTFFQNDYGIITSIDFDENNKLYFGATNTGFYTQKADSIINFNYNNSTLASSEVPFIFVQNSSHIFLTTRITPPVPGTEATLSFYNGNTFSKLSGNGDSRGLLATSDALFKTKDTISFLTSNPNSIYEYTAGNFIPFGNKDSYENFIYAPYKFVYDKNTQYWLISGQDGLYNCRSNSGELYNSSNSGLPINQLLSITFDDRQNLFIGTYGKGIAILKNIK